MAEADVNHASPDAPHAKLGTADAPRRDVLLLAAALALLVGLALLLHQLARWYERSRLHELAEQEALRLAQDVQGSVDEQLRQLRKLKSQWMRGRHRGPGEFEKAARDLQSEYSQFRTIAGLDTDGACRWVTPASGNEALINAELGADPFWKPAIETARAEESETATAWSVDATQHPSVGIVLPLAGEGENAAMAPLLVARVDMHRVIESTIGEGPPRRFAVSLHDGPTPILSVGPRDGLVTFGADAQLVRVANRSWFLRVVPREASSPGVGLRSSWVLWLGVPAAVFVTLLLSRLLAYRRRQVIETKKYVAALESLSEISTAVSGKLGAGRQILDQLAESARQLLQMQRSGVALVDETTGNLEIYALAGDVPTSARRRFPLSEVPATRRCVDGGELIMEGDMLAADAGDVNRAILTEFDARSVVMIPLHVEGKCLGMMALSGSRPRDFSETDRRLARLVGAQAAVILANNRLYGQARTTLDVQRDLLAQQDKLYAASAAIYQAATFRQSVQEIAERGPELLACDMCVVNLVSEDGKGVVVAAATGELAERVLGKHVPLAGSNGERALREGRPIVVEDANGPESRVHKAFREVLKIGSIMYVPLHGSDRRPMGMLSVIRHKPSRFTDSQRRVAQVFADRAAAAIENARLHDQTRKDAQTKAVLLRELHHRVKNNLAGIVALLSVNQPELSPAAQQWLDRAIERIGNMARAHDLFSGGMDKVEVEELVRQIVPSLSVIKPAGVNIRTELSTAHVRLATPQAVSLAMVLHELCSNAIHHGLGDGAGTLTIRSRLTDDGMAIDVIDDARTRGRRSLHGGGSGDTWAGRPVALEHGLGLHLVKELVRRELSGEFSLSTGTERGTVATVSFPVPGRADGSPA